MNCVYIEQRMIRINDLRNSKIIMKNDDEHTVMQFR